MNVTKYLLACGATFALFACGGGSELSDYMDDHPPSGNCMTDGSSGGTDTDGSCTAGETDGSSSGTATSSTSGGTSAGTDGGSGGSAGADACKSSAECGMDQGCIADFDGDKRSPFACMDMCLGENAEDKWCADDAACCDAAHVCTPRGYCQAP